jgi:hypothetical protein
MKKGRIQFSVFISLYKREEKKPRKSFLLSLFSPFYFVDGKIR